MSTGNETDERDPYAPPPEGAPDRPPAAPWNVARDGREPGRGDGRRPERREPREPRERQEAADPRRRNARIALWAGVWALLLPLFLPTDFTLVLGLVMGVAAVAVGVRALRGRPAGSPGPRVERGRGSTARRGGDATTPPPPAPAAEPARPRGPRPRGALLGLVAGAVAVAYVGGAWGFRVAYSGYYDCMDGALTKTAQDGCLDKLPESLHWVVKERV